MKLITGGTGFLGEELINRLSGKKRTVARNEGKLLKLDVDEIITGDISEKWIADKAVNGCNEVYHLAAYKHVGLAEEQPYQCSMSNIIGTMRILAASIEYKPQLVVGISTDKAAQVNGVYGASKLIMEALFAEAEKINPKTKYRVVRYGNVIGSTGSILPKWKKAIKKKKPITLTDPNATRFFWTREQAVDHIFECVAKAKDATPYIPEMKAVRIGDFLEALMERYGKTEVKEIGLQKGENLHETMDGKTFSNEVELLNKQEIKRIL